MRKIKKINGFLVVRFNDREKRNYPDLGSFGVIDAEQYTGDIDFDRDAMEYTDADCIEVAVEQARGLESESDFSEEPPVCTVIVESDAECSEEEVEPQLMIAGWEQQLETQVESKHYPDIDAKAAAHELHGFKVALYRLGMIDKSETEVDPDRFRPSDQGEMRRCCSFEGDGYRSVGILAGDELASMSPHDYAETEVVSGCTVQVLKCRKCGHESFAWFKDPGVDNLEKLLKKTGDYVKGEEVAPSEGDDTPYRPGKPGPSPYAAGDSTRGSKE